jgi:hypothetical protein
MTKAVAPIIDALHRIGGSLGDDTDHGSCREQAYGWTGNLRRLVVHPLCSCHFTALVEYIVKCSADRRSLPKRLPLSPRCRDATPVTAGPILGWVMLVPVQPAPVPRHRCRYVADSHETVRCPAVCSGRSATRGPRRGRRESSGAPSPPRPPAGGRRSASPRPPVMYTSRPIYCAPSVTVVPHAAAGPQELAWISTAEA